MTKLDPFSAQIVQLVRGMSDDAILALVRNQLGLIQAAPVALRAAPRGRSKARPKRSAKVAARATRKSSRRPKAATKKRRAPGRRSAKKQELLTDVERIIKGSKGVSVSDIAGKVKASKSRISAAIRELKADKRVFQGGDRRFARYAGDARTARQASTHARTSASGPLRKGRR